MSDWLIGIAASFVIAGLAYWKRSLSSCGMAAAMVVGTLLYALGSLPWFGTLIAFFISSTLLSKWKGKKKAELEGLYEKSGRRDAGQVFANGGLGALLCILNALWPDPIWLTLYIGVMATVNADTWATEIGGLSKGDPRSILTGKKVPKGTSGGISGLGLLATVAGGVFIGAVVWLFVNITTEVNLLYYLLVGGIAGTVGSLTDSLLGARLQTMYRCTTCGRDLEKKVHCGKQTVRVRGFSWMNNDAVNMLSSVVGGAVAVLVAGGF